MTVWTLIIGAAVIPMATLPVCSQEEQRTQTINLGGLRQATARVTATEDDYVIAVRMLPVRSFDDTTNARLNREKGRQLALQALAKVLSDKEAVEFAISGAQIKKVATDGKFFTLTLQVARKNVVLLRPGAKLTNDKQAERVAWSSILFTRKEDHAKTLENLVTISLTDIGIARKQALEQMDSADSFAKKIEAIQSGVVTNLESFRTEINNDLLLFSTEQQELRQLVDRHRQRVLNESRTALKRYKADLEGK